MSTRLTWVLVWLLFAGAASPAAGQSAPAADLQAMAANEPRRELKEGKVLRAHRVRGQPPRVDGMLDDESWSLAERAAGFVQREPDNGKPVTEETYVQVAYDDRYVYVAVTCLDSTPDGIRAGLARRDDLGATDEVIIAFDPRHDHLTGYAYRTNPSASQGEYTFFNDEAEDRDYNAVWDVRTGRSSRGWTAEFRIPFSQMRFSVTPQGGQVWGFNVVREVRRKGELGSWIPRPRGVRGGVSLFGHLVFEEAFAPPSSLEIVPYVAARNEHLVNRAGEAGMSAGGDVRMAIGTGATLAGTFNPDFGQVEQDPAVLNLSVFETFFPEKRPFFLEDSRTFVPPYPVLQLFHSRRIGRAPGRLPLAAGERLIERPDDTTILGATKLTGKGSGWTYGVMTAVTAREYAAVERPVVQADGTTTYVRGERLIEPATSYSVARIQRDILNGTSNIGGIVTGVIREQSDDAFTAGMDYNIRWDRNRTTWNGTWATSRAPGPGGMKTSGAGLTNFNFTRKHMNVFAHYDHMGRDIRINDIGFFRTRQNRNQFNVSTEAFQPDPGKRLRRYGGGFSTSHGWTNERLVWQRYGEFWLFAQFLNFWQMSTGGFGEARILDDLDTRGGPPIVKPSYRGVFLNINSDQRKRTRWSLNMNRGGNDAGGWFSNVNTSLSMQPSDRLQTSVSVGYSFGQDSAQWISNVDTTGDGVAEHVYGTLDRDVVDVTLRGTFAFTRDLTLQAYLQPFVAAGDYYDTRSLARPRSFEFTPAAIAFDPDFNRKSLRGNVVMRWEYKPGSTLFFVWDLSQSDLTRPGDFSAFRDLRTAFGANASHVLMVKASYWLNR